MYLHPSSLMRINYHVVVIKPHITSRSVILGNETVDTNPGFYLLFLFFFYTNR